MHYIHYKFIVKGIKSRLRIVTQHFVYNLCFELTQITILSGSWRLNGTLSSYITPSKYEYMIKLSNKRLGKGVV